nr:RNA-directed DNA polymerase, eukaryota, reverse transcriptase zinc-binding domain protein [Tanacetum cinerariifolium]
MMSRMCARNFMKWVVKATESSISGATRWEKQKNDKCNISLEQANEVGELIGVSCGRAEEEKRYGDQADAGNMDSGKAGDWGIVGKEGG